MSPNDVSSDFDEKLFDFSSSGSSDLESFLQEGKTDNGNGISKEWEAIERTLYQETGQQVTDPELLRECKLWRETFPHFRVKGTSVQVNEPEEGDKDTGTSVQTEGEHLNLSKVNEKRENIKNKVVDELVERLINKFHLNKKSKDLESEKNSVPETRQNIPDALKRTGTPETGENVMDMLKRIGTSESHGDVLDMLKENGRPETRENVTGRLKKIGTPETRESGTSDTLKGNDRAETRENVLDMLKRNGTPETREHLLDMLKKNGTPETREHVLDMLERNGTPETREHVLDMLERNGTPETHEKVTGRLKKIGTPETREQFLEMLERNGTPEARENVTGRLKKIGTPKTREQVLDTLKKNSKKTEENGSSAEKESYFERGKLFDAAEAAEMSDDDLEERFGKMFEDWDELDKSTPRPREIPKKNLFQMPNSYDNEMFGPKPGEKTIGRLKHAKYCAALESSSLVKPIEPTTKIDKKYEGLLGRIIERRSWELQPMGDCPTPPFGESRSYRDSLEELKPSSGFDQISKRKKNLPRINNFSNNWLERGEANLYFPIKSGFPLQKSDRARTKPKLPEDMGLYRGRTEFEEKFLEDLRREMQYRRPPKKSGLMEDAGSRRVKTVKSDVTDRTQIGKDSVKKNKKVPKSRQSKSSLDGGSRSKSMNSNNPRGTKNGILPPIESGIICTELKGRPKIGARRPMNRY